MAEMHESENCGHEPERRWDAASLAEHRRGEAASHVLQSGRDLAEDRGDDVAEAGGHCNDDDERDEREDQAVLDGGLPLLAVGQLSQDALEVVDKHVVVHPLRCADRFRDLWLARSPTDMSEGQNSLPADAKDCGPCDGTRLPIKV